MRERSVESYLVDGVEAMGGEAFKFSSPGRAGVVDRIIAIPWLPVHWVETKAPGKGVEGLQAEHRDWLVRNGFPWACLDTKARVDAWLAQRRMEVFLKKALS